MGLLVDLKKFSLDQIKQTIYKYRSLDNNNPTQVLKGGAIEENQPIEKIPEIRVKIEESEIPSFKKMSKFQPTPMNDEALIKKRQAILESDSDSDYETGEEDDNVFFRVPDKLPLFHKIQANVMTNLHDLTIKPLSEEYFDYVKDYELYSSCYHQMYTIKKGVLDGKFNNKVYTDYLDSLWVKYPKINEAMKRTIATNSRFSGYTEINFFQDMANNLKDNILAPLKVKIEDTLQENYEIAEAIKDSVRDLIYMNRDSFVIDEFLESMSSFDSKQFYIDIAKRMSALNDPRVKQVFEFIYATFGNVFGSESFAQEFLNNEPASIDQAISTSKVGMPVKVQVESEIEFINARNRLFTDMISYSQTKNVSDMSRVIEDLNMFGSEIGKLPIYDINIFASHVISLQQQFLMNPSTVLTSMIDRTRNMKLIGMLSSSFSKGGIEGIIDAVDKISSKDELKFNLPVVNYNVNYVPDKDFETKKFKALNEVIEAPIITDPNTAQSVCAINRWTVNGKYLNQSLPYEIYEHIKNPIKINNEEITPQAVMDRIKLDTINMLSMKYKEPTKALAALQSLAKTEQMAMALGYNRQAEQNMIFLKNQLAKLGITVPIDLAAPISEPVKPKPVPMTEEQKQTIMTEYGGMRQELDNISMSVLNPDQVKQAEFLAKIRKHRNIPITDQVTSDNIIKNAIRIQDRMNNEAKNEYEDDDKNDPDFVFLPNKSNFTESQDRYRYFQAEKNKRIGEYEKDNIARQYYDHMLKKRSELEMLSDKSSKEALAEVYKFFEQYPTISSYESRVLLKSPEPMDTAEKASPPTVDMSIRSTPSNAMDTAEKVTPMNTGANTPVDTFLESIDTELSNITSAFNQSYDLATSFLNDGDDQEVSGYTTKPFNPTYYQLLPASKDGDNFIPVSQPETEPFKVINTVLENDAAADNLYLEGVVIEDDRTRISSVISDDYKSMLRAKQAIMKSRIANKAKTMMTLNDEVKSRMKLDNAVEIVNDARNLANPTMTQAAMEKSISLAQDSSKIIPKKNSAFDEVVKQYQEEHANPRRILAAKRLPEKMDTLSPVVPSPVEFMDTLPILNVRKRPSYDVEYDSKIRNKRDRKGKGISAIRDAVYNNRIVFGKSKNPQKYRDIIGEGLEDAPIGPIEIAEFLYDIFKSTKYSKTDKYAKFDPYIKAALSFGRTLQNEKKPAKRLECQHCKGYNKLKYSGKGGIICKGCYEGKGMTSNREPVEEFDFEDVEEDNPKTKHLHSQVMDQEYNDREKNFEFLNSWDSFVKTIPTGKIPRSFDRFAKTDYIAHGPWSESKMDRLVYLLAYITLNEDGVNDTMIANLNALTAKYLNSVKDYEDVDDIDFSKFNSFESLKSYIKLEPGVLLFMEYEK